MKIFALLASMISLMTSGLAHAEQEWVSNPIVAALARPNDAETACLTALIQKQDAQAKDQKVALTAPLTDGAKYTFMYCFIDGSGYAKQCSKITFLTRDPKGWQVVGIEGDAYLMTASDMGIEAQVTDTKTHQARYVFDARECASIIVRGTGPLPKSPQQ